jgi:16S rRNA (uracil1498-N3)-methyltransferase
VVLFDGAGTDGVGTITQIGRRSVTVDVTSVMQRPYDAALRLTLGVAMGKAHRHGYLIEKCTALGVGAVCPLVTVRSVTKPGMSAVAKWTRRAIEASKQSGRSWVPEILPPSKLSDMLTDRSRYAWLGFADTTDAVKPLADQLSSIEVGAEILVFVGPEGGFTDEERHQLLKSGAVGTSLAPTVLRTETAAVAVCAAVGMCGARSQSD